MAKGIKNANAVTYKLKLASIKIINHRLKIVKKEQCKRKKMIKKQKTETMIAKCCKDGRKISLSRKKERNHRSDIRDNTNPDQTKDEYSL